MTEDKMIPEDAPPAIYGPDGEPQFFQDPAMDRFAAVILNLASELWVQTERVETLTQILRQKGVLSEAVLADAALDPGREALFNAYLDRVLTPLRESAR